MQIELPPEVEQIAREAVRSGRFVSVEEFVSTAIRNDLSREALQDVASNEKATGESYEEWRKRFDALLSTVKPRNPNVDDSRESMYPAVS